MPPMLSLPVFERGTTVAYRTRLLYLGFGVVVYSDPQSLLVEHEGVRTYLTPGCVVEVYLPPYQVEQGHLVYFPEESLRVVFRVLSVYEHGTEQWAWLYQDEEALAITEGLGDGRPVTARCADLHRVVPT